jgi:hypothetical protein
VPNPADNNKNKDKGEDSLDGPPEAAVPVQHAKS